MDLAILLTTLILGLGVLLSYFVVFGYLRPGNYIKHPYWFGTPPKAVKVIVALQLLAAVGFLISIITWIIKPPSTPSYIICIILGILLFAAIIWPFALYLEVPIIVVASLIITAVCSLMLLGIAVYDSPWWVILGWTLLCLVTVIADAGYWNVNYIKNLEYN